MLSPLVDANCLRLVYLLMLSVDVYGHQGPQPQAPQAQTDKATPSAKAKTDAVKVPTAAVPAGGDPLNGAVAAMQDSVFAQTKSVAAQRGAQANSLALQRASLMKQAQGASPAFMPPSDNPDTIPTMPSAPITPLDPAKTAVKSPVFAMLDRMRKMDESGFILPWDQPDAMTMPNVRVPTTACPALVDEEIDKLSQSAGQKNAVAPELIAAIMRQESGFRPCAVSTEGAMGLMQLMPETVQTLGVDDPFAPEQNVEAGARYLKQLLDRYHGDRRLALSAYNAGPGRVDQANGVPDIPETQDYVERVLGSLGEP
jgi:soluble lytic murein transglycosylase-like protein